MSLIEKLKNHEATIGVIGLGYVGLPLLVEFARAGFDAVGIDVDQSKVSEVNAGRSYIGDVATETLSDGTMPTIGMLTVWSATAKPASLMPSSSAPTMIAVGPV